jgi:hypothetical protein
VDDPLSRDGFSLHEVGRDDPRIAGFGMVGACGCAVQVLALRFRQRRLDRASQ